MKKKVLILGSTGSIGRNTYNIFKKDKKKFKIVLLSTNKNISRIISQALECNVKNIIISNKKKFFLAKDKYKSLKINFYNSFDILNKLFKKKEVHYSMQSIVGIDGLKPTLDLIKLSKKIAIVNKESLVCGWNLINKELKLHNTKFIPIDSEHFSIHNLIENIDIKEIKKIYITASGGPFLKYKNIKKYKINLPQALSHPSWKMGKKISIDSATMMNKVFEVIEAKNIFNIPYNKINIITHPKSYIHSIVELNNGLIKFLGHNPDMKIPIINSIYENKKTILSKAINFKILNNLNFRKINHTQFPFVKILNKLPSYNSLYETAIITTNDFYVNLFLNKKIDYLSMLSSIKKILNHKNLIKYKKIRVKNVSQVVNFREELSSKLQNLVYKN